MSKKIDLISIIIVFIWISFFPTPVQEKSYFSLKIFMLLSFLWMVITKRKQERIFSTKDIPMLFFITAISFNVVFAQFQAVAFRSYLDLVIPLFFIYYLAKNGLSFDDNFICLARVISLISILIAALGVFECFYAINPIYEYFVENPFYHRYITGFVRPMSTQMHTVPLGTYLLGCLPFNFILFRQERNFFKLLGSVGIVLNVVIIILTFSRGVFFGLIAMVTFYLLMQGNYKKVIFFIIGVLTLIFLCSYLPYPFSRFSFKGILFVDGGVLSTYLADRWIMVKSIINKHPFVGVGLQHFRIQFDSYYRGIVKVPFEIDCPAMVNVPFEFKITDNMYLAILSETGIIGFLGFIVLAAYFLIQGCRQVALLNAFPVKRLKLLVVLSVFVGFLIVMMAYDLFYWPSQYIYFCILIGILASYFKAGSKTVPGGR